MDKCNGCKNLGCMEMPNSWVYRCSQTQYGTSILQVPRSFYKKAKGKFDVPKPEWCPKDK